MSILDALKYSTGDADKDAQLNRGLLMAGLQLMQARGSLFPALGQAGMTGLQAADMTKQGQQARDRAAMEAQMRKLQIGQAQRQERIDALPQQFYRPPSAPAIDATGGMETAVEAPNNASGPGGVDTDGLMRAYMGMGAIPQAAQLRAFMQKPEVQPLVSKPGDVARDPKTGAILWQNPEAADGEKDAFLRLLKARGIAPDSPQGQKLLDQYLQKQATHPAPVSINNAPYAPVMTVEGPNGPMAIQPGSRPGQATGVVVNPLTGKPAVPVKEGGGKLPAEIQRMNAAADTMAVLLGDYETWLKANNPRDPSVQGNPAARAAAQSLMKNIQLQFKELQALGALAGPDLALMEAAITDPFTFKGAYYGRDGLMGQISQARRLIDVRRQAIAGQSGGARPPSPDAGGAADPLGLRKP